MRFVLTLLLGLAACSTTACASAPAAELRAETLRIRIIGMTCPIACPPRVQAALGSVPGVESATVVYEERCATVVCRGCDRAALLAALHRQGFGGVVE